MRTPPPPASRRASRRRLGRALAALGTVLAMTATTAQQVQPAEAVAPKVSVTKVTGGLAIPWDVTWVGEVMLFNERAGRVWTKRPGAAAKRVSLPLPKLYVHSEGGLLGMVADPDAAKNHYFYTCQSVAKSSGAASDVQVWKWRLTSDTKAEKVKVLIKGGAVGSGRHNGCRLEFRSSGIIYVGTGDATKDTRPQSLYSLSGKVLRVRSDGSIPTTNPFYSKGANARYIWNYGHRNIQGLAKRPGISQLWSVEQGTNRDDEINLVSQGANYGWSPAPGYNEKQPMTDLKRFPKAVPAKWSSGYPTIATSGATFVDGRQWGEWNGRLMVALLKGQGIATFAVSKDDKVTRKETIATSYGRIRTVEQGPDGALYFLTSNGSNDSIYRLTVS